MTYINKKRHTGREKVCVCEWERSENRLRERERQTYRQTDRGDGEKREKYTHYKKLFPSLLKIKLLIRKFSLTATKRAPVWMELEQAKKSFGLWASSSFNFRLKLLGFETSLTGFGETPLTLFKPSIYFLLMIDYQMKKPGRVFV